MNESWYRFDSQQHAFTMTVHVQPDAKRNEIVGLHGAALKIRIAAPPLDGKANAALITFMAEVFDVPARQVRLLQGESGRRKVIEIVGSRKDPAALVK